MREHHNKEAGRMGTYEYVVAQIDGDYAQLQRVDEPSGELKLVARALLPEDIMEGSHLKYECLQYENCIPESRKKIGATKVH